LNGITKSGLDAFVKQQYSKAAEFYMQAVKMDPNNYTHYENVGICYYMNQNYSNALPYFQKVIQYPNATSGKSEFYLAMCFIPLNNNKEACTALNSAKKKGYPGVDEYISKYCK